MSHAPQASVSPAGHPAAAIFPPPAPDGQEDCLCFLLRAAARRATALYTRHLAQIGLGLPQHAVIGMAAAFEKRNGRPATISELAQALDLDRTTLTRNLKPVVAAGLLTVEPAGRGAGRGGRAKAVRATSAGRQAYRAGIALWRQAQDELRASLGNDEAGLVAGLAAVIAGTDAVTAAVAPF